MIDMDDVKKYVKENGLDQKNRRREIVDQRSYLCYYLRANEMTYPQIGKIFNQDHATVMHSVKKYEDLCTTIGYAINVKDLIFRFPISQKVKKTLSDARIVVVRLSPSSRLKIQAYRIDHNLKSNEAAINSLINNINTNF